jgi:hypothetical protein
MIIPIMYAVDTYRCSESEEYRYFSPNTIRTRARARAIALVMIAMYTSKRVRNSQKVYYVQGQEISQH